jgi:predicted DNA-binding transcriptional regulator AlpA
MQPLLNLTIHHRTALVTVGTAMAVLGVDGETVHARIESGALPWAWDIGVHDAAVQARGEQVNGGVRIWARSLIAPDPRLKLDLVVGCIIGERRERLRAGEVCRLFLCSRPTVWGLVKSGALAGPLVDHTQWVTRASLVRFLTERRLS